MNAAYITGVQLYTCMECTLDLKRTLREPVLASLQKAIVLYTQLQFSTEHCDKRTEKIVIEPGTFFLRLNTPPLNILLINTVHRLTPLLVVDFI